MSQREPGLELHEWETRWAEIEEALALDPVDALADACDEIEELLGVHEGDDELRAQYPELITAYESARDTADAVERGDDVDPGDIGAAIENLRLVRRAVLPVGDE